ncbi:MAG: hypothetical protein GY794_19010, partial [bacterium]|nr:hypothetical protein [bacterium]
RSDIASETIPLMRLTWHVVWIKRDDKWMALKARRLLDETEATVDEDL